MVTRAPRPCRKSGCPHLCRDGSGFCANHNPESGWERQPRPNRHQRGYGTKWEKLRKKVLQRDTYLCQVCKAAGRPTPANQVDHITPKSQGGTDDPGNLQAICAECHKAKTRAESRQARTGKAPMGCGPDGVPLDPQHHWSKCKET